MNRSVLVVDDDQKMLYAIQRRLERAGLAVDVAESVHEATVKMSVRRFDIALLDYFLERGECGCQLIAPLRASSPSIRIVVVSGLADSPALIRHAYDAGADLIESKVRADWVALALRDRDPPISPARPEIDLWAWTRDIMLGSLLVHRGRIGDAARALGIDRTSLRRALRKMGPVDAYED